MKRGLKLYVWPGVLTDYTSGIAFALATSAEEAKAMLIDDGVYASQWDGVNLNGVSPVEWETPTSYHVWGGS